MQAGLPRDLRVERDHEQVALADRHRVAVDGGEHLDVVAADLDPRRADEHGAHGLAGHAGDPQVGLEGADLAAERVAPALDVHHAEVRAVEHDHPRAGPEHRRAASGPARAAARRAPRARRPASSSSTRRRGSPARRGPSRSAGTRTSRTSAPRSRSTRPCASKSPWSARTPTSTTSLGWRGAAARRACGSRATSSRRPGPPTRARRAPGRRSGWSPRRSPPRASPGPRT